MASRPRLLASVLLALAGLASFAGCEPRSREAPVLPALEPAPASGTPASTSLVAEVQPAPGSATRLPAPATEGLTGRVLDPAGEPTRAYLTFVWRVGERLATKRLQVRADGRFELALEPGLEGGLLATTYQERLGSVFLEPVRSGDRDLILRLRPPRTFTLSAVDPAGRPIDPQSVANAELSRRILGGTLRDQNRVRVLGGWRWPVPDVPALLTLRTWRYETLELELPDPEAIGEHLTVTLTPRPVVQGVVLAGGRPVAEARVWLEPMPEPGAPDPWLTHGGLPTDADGVFEVPLHASGRYRVRAHHEAEGQGELSGLELDARVGARGLAVELDLPLGAIEGRLLLPEGHSTAEIELHFSHSGEWFLLRPDEEGRFRARGLSPGSWRVHVSPALDPDRPRDPELKYTDSREGYFPQPSWLPLNLDRVVELRRGSTEALLLDGSRAPGAWLAGEVRLDGSSLEDPDQPDTCIATAALAAVEESDGAPSRASVMLTGPCRFRLAALAPGAQRLRVQLNLGGWARWVLQDELTLGAGENTWTQDLATGALQVVPAEGAGTAADGGVGASGTAPWVVRWHGPGRLEVRVREPERLADGTLSFPRVPAGSLELLGPDERVLATTEVRPGQVGRIELASTGASGD